VQCEARLAQINAAVEAAKEKKKAAKAKKKSGSHKKAADWHPKATEVQAIPETRLRHSTRTTKGDGHPVPEDIDLGNKWDNDDDDFLAPLDSDHEGGATEFDTDLLQEQQKGRGKKSSSVPLYSLHPDDPTAFLKLATFLNIFLAEFVTEEKLQEADTLVRVYCKDLIQVSIFTLPIHLLIQFD